MSKTPEITPSQSAAEAGSGGLYNASGRVMRLAASPLFSIGPAAPGPSLRRGALLALPIGAALAVEFGFNAPTKGAIATGAMFAAFAGLDAPAGPRAAWQAAAAPLIGVMAALGILTSQSAPLAVLTMALVGAAAGYLFSYSLRLAIFGLVGALTLLVSQGLFLPVDDTLPALLWGTVGGLTQVLWSLIVWVVADRCRRGDPSGWDREAVAAALRSNLSLESEAFRHAFRFGASLAVGVAIYRAFDMDNHGFWIPLTILFVMRPDRDETYLRTVLRAAGTVLGLILATLIFETVGYSDAVVVVVLTVATALTLGLLTVQYALFTAAITVYVVVLTDALGEPTWEADKLRLIGTAVGLLITFLAFVVWPDPERGRDLKFRVLRPPPDPPGPAAR
ncbi:MAG TPA: FUSC family protein [Solirubrobacterales bacterium]|nr:FUSC family protein [Solirubrobacterales bacterium]